MITDLWYKNAIVYSLDLETFMDGNGDGCGDFHGLMQRLDYLESLGRIAPLEDIHHPTANVAISVLDNRVLALSRPAGHTFRGDGCC